MGLIKAGLGAINSTLADQWKEFFYCDAMTKEVLVVKGQKRVSSRSSNTKGNDNIISNGSVIAVADGQCMLIVEQGKIVEVCAEPGEFVYDTSSEPSIFTGSLGKGIIETFKTIGKRFTFGGDPGKRSHACPSVLHGLTTWHMRFPRIRHAGAREGKLILTNISRAPALWNRRTHVRQRTQTPQVGKERRRQPQTARAKAPPAQDLPRQRGHS